MSAPKACLYCGIDLDDAAYGFDYVENYSGAWPDGFKHPTMWRECVMCRKVFDDLQRLINNSDPVAADAVKAFARLVIAGGDGI